MRAPCARPRGVGSQALARAYATVWREHYLGPGPWRVVEERGYVTTEDDDPRHLYRDVLVAIDEERRLNNGQPSALASWLDRLDLAPGERVAHVGCGVGYYTALLAEVVGSEGSVLGVEIDPDLAARAAANLDHYAQVEVRSGDGSRVSLGSRDAVFVNAGATGLKPSWLEALAMGGRLVLPLTVDLAPGGAGVGQMLRIERTPAGHAAGFLSPVGIFPCVGGRSDGADRALQDALQRGGRAGRPQRPTRPPSALGDLLAARARRLPEHRRSRSLVDSGGGPGWPRRNP